MTRSANIERIEKTTGLSWQEWLEYLEEINADNLSHKEIAEHVYKKLEDTLDNAGWWAQGVTVAYEQHIGRRRPGQNSDGTYEFSVTKTLDTTMKEAMETWLAFAKDKKEFHGISIATSAMTSSTDRAYHWSCKLENGTRVSVDTWQKSPEKAGLAITHTKLADESAMEHWRDFWKDILTHIGEHSKK